MKNLYKTSSFLVALCIIVLFFSLFFYNSLYAVGDESNKAGGLVPCGIFAKEDGTGLSTPCEFEHLIIIIQKVIDFVLFRLLMPITAIAFAYSGIILLFSGGNSSKKEKAIKIFQNVALGFVIALGAWLIVKTLINLLGFTSDLI